MSELQSKRILGPLNRVEGDLEIRIEVQAGQVAKAWVNAPLFRGFERILLNKPPADALVYTPRICGICSVAQSIAAAQALAQAQGLTPTNNGQLALDLLLASENLADHLSHFYLFFMPDFARDFYADKEWHSAIAARFKAQVGSANNQVLPARAAFLHITGLLAGKWPHSLSIQPGGSSKPLNQSELLRVQTIISGFRNFLETVLFGDSLENLSALASSQQLTNWAQLHPDSDFARFLTLSADLKLYQLGRGSDRFMSFGAYGAANSQRLFKSGQATLHNGQLQSAAMDEATITEDLSSSWMHGSDNTPVHPWQGLTEPDVAQSGYSWCKAPRLNDQVVETGALARQLVNGHPLLCDIVTQHGGSVHGRIVARMLELALVVPAMERWCQQIDLEQRFCDHGQDLKNGRGAGIIEAARGSLGHWLQVKDGRISNYQIIAPTTWNFSPRDGNGQAGALEQALVGCDVPGEIDDAVALQHVIRSFDPCMVCTVH